MSGCASIESQLHLCPQLRAQLEAGLADECPLSASDGNFIRSGFDEQLDSLRELARGGKQWIAAYQQQQMSETGIANLKVGYNKVFGYYLEVTNAHRDKIPDRIHPQANTEELRTIHHAGIEGV